MRLKFGPLEIELPGLTLPMFLAVATTIGFFALLAKICLYEVPSGSKEIAFAMIGSVSTAWTGIVGYYYGSSAGSAKKTEIMAASGKKDGDA